VYSCMHHHNYWCICAGLESDGMQVCLYIRMYVCMYVYRCMYTGMGVFMHASPQLLVHLCRIGIRWNAGMYVCVHACTNRTTGASVQDWNQMECRYVCIHGCVCACMLVLPYASPQLLVHLCRVGIRCNAGMCTCMYV
jgi:hypothetical protein